MKKYLVIFIFIIINSITAESVGENASNRIRQDLSSHSRTNIKSDIYRDEEELISFIESTMATHLIPGLSISVVKDENIVWERYFGYSNIENETAVNESTMFILSSVSKTVTATALMQLFEDGLFSLDDNINSYLPFNVNHPDYPLTPITFKMLLSHTSGIKDQWGVMPYYDGDSVLELGYYLEQYLTPQGEFYSANGCFSDSQPGTNYIYSNNGAALIGYLVERLSNQPFNEYCNENIFEPLNMNNAAWLLSEIDDLNQIAMPYQLSAGSGDTCYEIGCGIYDQSNPCFCDSECVYYDDCCSDYNEVCGEDGSGSSGIQLSPLYHYGYSDYPSGQLRTTSNNLGKFVSAYINDGVYNGTRILEEETIELIKTVQYPNINSQQGLIWYYKNGNAQTLFGHNGGDLGSLTEMFISYLNNIGVVVLSNSSNYNAIIQIENAVFEFAEQTSFIVSGDVNQDSTVNIQDIILTVNMILTNQYSNEADLNSDNAVDVLDVIQLVNIILN